MDTMNAIGMARLGHMRQYIHNSINRHNRTDPVGRMMRKVEETYWRLWRLDLVSGKGPRSRVYRRVYTLLRKQKTKLSRLLMQANAKV